MEKINKIGNVLDFYIKTNKLKTTKSDFIEQYSVADDIFGSMILAVAFDSEFKETNDLGKILHMLFSNQDSNNKLVYKYRKLDNLLTELIVNEEKNMSFDELVNRGSKIVSLFCDNPDLLKCNEIFKFYYLNFRLKNKTRSGWDKKHWNVKSDRIEKISDHIVGTIGIAIAMNREFNYNIDIDKVLKMLVIHETGETLIGDITPFDGITPEQKKEIEHKAMKDALGDLSDKDNLLKLLFEFDEHETLESMYCHYCDKIEADLQSKVYQDNNMHRSLDDQEGNCVFKSSIVEKMIEDGAKTAFDIWYLWDKGIYKKFSVFPEFSSLLDIAACNDLSKFSTNRIVERINLSDNDFKYVFGRLYSLAYDLFYNCKDDYKCIYFTNYHNDSGIGTISVTVVLKSCTHIRHFSEVMKMMEKHLNSNSNGINIKIKCDYISHCLKDSNVLEELSESSIIFDKDGRITKAKEENNDIEHSTPFYLNEYVPPIDNEIKLRLSNGEMH